MAEYTKEADAHTDWVRRQVDGKVLNKGEWLDRWA